MTMNQASRRATGTARALALFAICLGLMTTGCGGSAAPPPAPVPVEDPNLTPPAIVLETPTPKQRFKLGDPIEFNGRVEVREGNWTPALSVFLITVGKTKTFKMQYMSPSVKLVPSETPGIYTFSFKAKTKNWDPGRCYIKLSMHYGNKLVDQPASDVREIEVTK